MPSSAWKKKDCTINLLPNALTILVQLKKDFNEAWQTIFLKLKRVYPKKCILTIESSMIQISREHEYLWISKMNDEIKLTNFQMFASKLQ